MTRVQGDLSRVIMTINVPSPLVVVVSQTPVTHGFYLLLTALPALVIRQHVTRPVTVFFRSESQPQCMNCE